MKKLYFALLLLLAVATGAWAQGNCTGVPVVPSQDCPNAIPLCGLRYTYPTGAICGGGNIDGEIPSGSCLSSDERNTTWYVFKVRKTGYLKFAIIPLDALTPPDSGELDYDWALFKLPNGSINTTAVCAQLNNNLSWQVSCNYSGQRGATGMLDTSGVGTVNSQGAGGTKWNPPVLVNRDEVYVLAVDNFTGDDALTGYTIRFRDTTDRRVPQDFNPGIADITPEGEDPKLERIVRAPNCINNGVIFAFNKDIICESIDDGDITVINLADPSIQYNVDSLSPVGGCQGGSAQDWFIRFTPAGIDTNYAIVIRDSVIDICGKVLISDTIKFRINPFIRLESFVEDVNQDSVCSGRPIEVRAIPDENLRARVSDFTYTWSLLDSASGIATPLVSSDSFLIDTNIVTVTRNVPLRTTIFLIVDARGVRTSCAESDTIAIRINPLPTAPVITPVTACFGDVATIGAGAPQDTVYYNYKWTTSLQRPNNVVPQSGFFFVRGDTLNRSSASPDSIQVRGQNDTYKVTVSFKPKFGGCEAPQQTVNLLVGKYLAPRFSMDSVFRPGKNGFYVLDTNTFYNQSYIQTRNTNRFAMERWDFGDSSTLSQPFGTTESVTHIYRAPGQYRITLYLVDSLMPGVYCSQSYSKLVEFVPSQWESGRRGEIGFLPNVVTPNNDGRNDYLEFVGIPSNGYSLDVFNRWGKKVYSANPYNNTWVPKDIQQGTYFFRLKKVSPNLPSEAKSEYTGWFEVIY